MMIHVRGDFVDHCGNLKIFKAAIPEEVFMDRLNHGPDALNSLEDWYAACSLDMMFYDEDYTDSPEEALHFLKAATTGRDVWLINEDMICGYGITEEQAILSYCTARHTCVSEE